MATGPRIEESVEVFSQSDGWLQALVLNRYPNGILVEYQTREGEMRAKKLKWPTEEIRRPSSGYSQNTDVSRFEYLFEQIYGFPGIVLPERLVGLLRATEPEVAGKILSRGAGKELESHYLLQSLYLLLEELERSCKSLGERYAISKLIQQLDLDTLAGQAGRLGELQVSCLRCELRGILRGISTREGNLSRGLTVESIVRRMITLHHPQECKVMELAPGSELGIGDDERDQVVEDLEIYAGKGSALEAEANRADAVSLKIVEERGGYENLSIYLAKDLDLLEIFSWPEPEGRKHLVLCKRCFCCCDKDGVPCGFKGDAKADLRGFLHCIVDKWLEPRGVFISTDFAEGRAGQEFIDSELRMTLEELELDGVIKFHWGWRESAQGEERWIVVQKIGADHSK